MAVIISSESTGDSASARLNAIDAELARMAGKTQANRPGGSVIYLCSCGFGTDDREWLDGHLFRYPGHHERNQPSGRP